MDSLAFRWANALCGNTDNAVAIELSAGGLALIAKVNTLIAVCGVSLPFTINGNACELWRSYVVNEGDIINIGFAAKGCRSYLAVSGGFQIKAQFGSVATVPREAIGGLNGGALQLGDVLPCMPMKASQCLLLPPQYRPYYSCDITVRAVATYQYAQFSEAQKQCFFNTPYTVSQQCDRMAYRLEGDQTIALSCAQAMLSEGICLGAIQIPPSGQPIVMMNDRQTIGGYPKIGSVLSTDLAKLGQLVAGDTVRFQLIDRASARAQLLLTQTHFEQALGQLQTVI